MSDIRDLERRINSLENGCGIWFVFSSLMAAAIIGLGLGVMKEIDGRLNGIEQVLGMSGTSVDEPQEEAK
jgi:hypothetical protein